MDVTTEFNDNSHSNTYQELYNTSFDSYNNLGKNLVQALEILLTNHKIRFLTIYYRVKELDSFLDKIDRKAYTDPFEELEDFCGIRIICYYQSDIGKIRDIVKNELFVTESKDKEASLDYDQFGYRSHHIIAHIDESWTKVPNYRDLKGKKAEIQIRSVLMHAWAEIEHNLAYKKEAHIPEQFRRKLHLISAMLEVADEQFENLKKESKEYQEQMLIEAKNNVAKFEDDASFNIDSLQALLDILFPDAKKSIENTSRLFDEMQQYDITLKDLKKAYDKVNPHFQDIMDDLYKIVPYRFVSQAASARIMLDLIFPRFYKRKPERDIRKQPTFNKWVEIVNR